MTWTPTNKKESEKNRLHTLFPFCLAFFWSIGKSISNVNRCLFSGMIKLPLTLNQIHFFLSFSRYYAKRTVTLNNFVPSGCLTFIDNKKSAASTSIYSESLLLIKNVETQIVLQFWYSTYELHFFSSVGNSLPFLWNEQSIIYFHFHFHFVFMLRFKIIESRISVNCILCLVIIFEKKWKYSVVEWKNKNENEFLWWYHLSYFDFSFSFFFYVALY